MMQEDKSESQDLLSRLRTAHLMALTTAVSSMKGERFRRRFICQDSKNLLTVLDLDSDQLENEIFGEIVKRAEDKFEEFCFEKGIPKKLTALEESFSEKRHSIQSAGDLEMPLKFDDELPLSIVSAREASRAVSMEIKRKEQIRLQQQVELAEDMAALEAACCTKLLEEIRQTMDRAEKISSELKSASLILQ